MQKSYLVFSLVPLEFGIAGSLYNTVLIFNSCMFTFMMNADTKLYFCSSSRCPPLPSAFVTLLNGEQAQCAIKDLHQHVLREREISVQLQPTDALLCIANLPCAFTQQQFEELVRPFGNLERCFLVYSASTGHSKGYGFVEYMKKDSAARAKSELLGKQLGSRMLYVHWTEVGSLTYPLLHSKCLCVDRLPSSLLTAQDLRNALADTYTPAFCQVEIHHTLQTHATSDLRGMHCPHYYFTPSQIMCCDVCLPSVFLVLSN